MIELGNEVKEIVSGFCGIAVSRIEYLNGCVQFGIRGKVGSDGKVPDTQYFDDKYLEFVGKGVSVQKKPTGGNMGIDTPK